jgi:hypothetical protein
MSGLVEAGTMTDTDSGDLRPTDDGRYWVHDGEPTLLVGASNEDNLFQIPGLESEIDALAAAGGNYVRNTMSSREEFAVWPFAEVGDGVYDLDTPNDEYWDRLDRFLDLTAERGIVPQFELWAFHDFVKQPNWGENPWNPANTVSYDTGDVTLPETVEGNYHGDERHPFFLTVPGANDDGVVRAHQERFVARVLEAIEGHDHVLVCITNEIFSQFPPEWSRYWVDFAHERIGAPVAEMFQEEDLTHEQHRESLDDPDRYDFVDASQNSRQSGDTHWERLQWVREQVADAPRPVNHVKTYGGETHWTDGPERGVERFWRNVVGGAASTRFHRPPSGPGLNERSRRHVRSASAFADRFPVTRARVDGDHDLLADREPGEAYLAYVPGEQYAVYFPDGGGVDLELPGTGGAVDVEWLHVEGTNWQTYDPTSVDGSEVRIEAPCGGHWIAVLTAR